MNWATPFWWPSLASEIPSIFGATGLELTLLETIPSDNQRMKVREYLNDKWSSEFNDDGRVFDLSRRPNGNSMNFSISHCPNQVGILSIPKSSSCTVGLDIEITARVKPEVAARISDEAETNEAPSPAYLWTAKESFFKAAPEGLQPTLISQIKISGWNKIADSLWSFSAKTKTDNPVTGAGLCIQSDDFVYAISLIQKS